MAESINFSAIFFVPYVSQSLYKYFLNRFPRKPSAAGAGLAVHYVWYIIVKEAVETLR